MNNVVAPPDPALTQTPTADGLNKYVGKHIKEICGCAFHSDASNHCAHFVSHVLGFHFGYTCKDQTGKGKTGASVRVHEVFAMCPEVGEWANCNGGALLVFVTSARNVNVKSKRMENVPRKHIGIYLGGTIWHYSNSKRKVVTQTAQEFSHHYPGKDISLFYGTFPK